VANKFVSVNKRYRTKFHCVGSDKLIAVTEEFDLLCHNAKWLGRSTLAFLKHITSTFRIKDKGKKKLATGRTALLATG
jgi:hypothetical protein